MSIEDNSGEGGKGFLEENYFSSGCETKMKSYLSKTHQGYESMYKTTLAQFRAFYLCLISVMLFLPSGCKKTDVIQQIQDKGVESAVVRFFNRSQITDSNAQVVADLIKRKENDKPFIKDFVKYGGYPVWKNAIVTSGRRHHASTLGRNSSEEETSVLIPFALDNDSSVSSILQVTIRSTDTAFNMLYKWQYNVNGYHSQETQNNADEFALLFMGMESQVFGHSTFTILDSGLFAKTTDSAKHKLLRIKSITSGGDVAARENVLTVSICYKIMVPPNEGQLVGCPPGAPCNDPVVETVCDTKIYYFPETPGGGGGGIDEGQFPTPLPPDDGGGGGSTPPGEGGWTDNPCLPGKKCDRIPGWEPIFPPVYDLYLANVLGLNSVQDVWLSSNADFAEAIYNGLQEDNLSPEAKIIAKIIIDQGVNNLLNTAWDEQFATVALNHIEDFYTLCCPGLLQPINPTRWIAKWNSETAADYAWNRKMHPEWSKAKCLWEASQESFHTALDLAGMVPVFGEVFDLTNGVLYAIKGDGLNASLSIVSMLPIAGWVANGVKYVRRLDNLKYYTSVVAGKSVITFGSYNSSRFRKALGITSSSKQAHHVLPRADIIARHEVVQRATQVATNQGFHIDNVLNGIPVETWRNQPNHSSYTNKIYGKLEAFFVQNPNADPTECYNKLLSIINEAKQAIVNNPTIHLNDLNF